MTAAAIAAAVGSDLFIFIALSFGIACICFVLAETALAMELTLCWMAAWAVALSACEEAGWIDAAVESTGKGDG